MRIKSIVYFCEWGMVEAGGGSQMRSTAHFEHLKALGSVHVVHVGGNDFTTDASYQSQYASLLLLSDVRRKYRRNAIRNAFVKLFCNAWGMTGEYQKLDSDTVGELVRHIYALKPDLVFSHGGAPAYIAEQVMDRLGQPRPRTAIDWDVLDTPDAMVAYKFARDGKKTFFRGLYDRFSNWKLKKIVAEIAGRQDVQFVCAQTDKDALHTMSVRAPIHVLRNQMNLPDAPLPYPSVNGPPTVIFVGSMAYWPNTQGILHFVKSIWPAVRAHIPDAACICLGRNPPGSVRELHGMNGVEVVGGVDNLIPFYQRAHLAIAPMIYSNGATLKTLESFAMARPIVSYADSIFRHGLERSDFAISAKNAAEFSAAVANLLKNPEMSRSLGLKAFEYVSVACDPENISNFFRSCIVENVERGQQ